MARRRNSRGVGRASAMSKEKDEKILQLTNEVEYLKQKSDVLSFTQVSSTCSSGIGDLSLAEKQYQQEHQHIKPKKRTIRQAATKQPNPDPLESNQTKRRRTSIPQTKSAKLKNMEELSLITADDAYYTCLGSYDPIKSNPVSKNTKRNIEIPNYRLKKYSCRNSAKGIELMSDAIFQKRHFKHERSEQICKRRDLRQIRELIRVENLRKGRNKHHSQKSNDNNKEELTTLLPSPSNIKSIEITNKLPVSAFGINLYRLTC
eukprot:XP_008181484.1 PREDICTED: uncharacterized protein LOC100571546 [Acyrthosiphon pisum]